MTMSVIADKPKMSQPFQVLVIAMLREQERRESIKRNLLELGLKFEFIDATDLSEGKLDADSLGYHSEKAHQVLGRDLTPPEIGCFVSHRKAWQIASASAAPTLILESDALLDDVSATVTRALCEQSLSWEMAMLNYHKCTPSLWQQQRIIPSHKLVKFANRRVYCLSTYLITKTGAQKLLRHADSFHLPSDDYATGGWIDKDIDLYAVTPRCASMCNHAEQSTIDESRQLSRKGEQRRMKNNQALLRRIELAVREIIRSLRLPNKGL